MEVNWDEGVDNHGESDNRHAQGGLGIAGGDYQDNWGGQTSDGSYAGESIDSSIDLDWGEIENYGGR